MDQGLLKTQGLISWMLLRLGYLVLRSLQGSWGEERPGLETGLQLVTDH